MHCGLHKRVLLELLAGLEPKSNLKNSFIFKGFRNPAPIPLQFDFFLRFNQKLSIRINSQFP